MLLILRDCYNREAKERMMTYEICRNRGGEFKVQKIYETRHVLQFVNSTVADKFLKNFRDMLEKAKDLI